MLPSRYTTAVCLTCETRRPLSELKQGGGSKNWRCRDAAACAKASSQAHEWDGDTSTLSTSENPRTRALAFAGLDDDPFFDPKRRTE